MKRPLITLLFLLSSLCLCAQVRSALYNPANVSNVGVLKGLNDDITLQVVSGNATTNGPRANFLEMSRVERDKVWHLYFTPVQVNEIITAVKSALKEKGDKDPTSLYAIPELLAGNPFAMFYETRTGYEDNFRLYVNILYHNEGIVLNRQLSEQFVAMLSGVKL